MRKSSDVLIYIDVQKALNSGIRFFLSDNGVVLTEGDERGFLSPEFFGKVDIAEGSARAAAEGPRSAKTKGPKSRRPPAVTHLEGKPRVQATIPAEEAPVVQSTPTTDESTGAPAQDTVSSASKGEDDARNLVTRTEKLELI